MTEPRQFEHVETRLEGHVGHAVFSRPPHNYFNLEMMVELADAVEHLEAQEECRVIAIGSLGKVFCAGAELGDGPDSLDADGAGKIYEQAGRLVSGRVPLIARVQGAAIGGGFGLAAAADFRIAAPDARFVANFASLGLHAGFGLTALLPPIAGWQKTSEILFTAPRLTGEDALEIGLVDRLAPLPELDRCVAEFAGRIAAGAPLAVQSMRHTLRQGRAEAMRAAIARELSQQAKHFLSRDFAEGVAAAKERRKPVFRGD